PAIPARTARCWPSSACRLAAVPSRSSARAPAAAASLPFPARSSTPAPDPRSESHPEFNASSLKHFLSHGPLQIPLRGPEIHERLLILIVRVRELGPHLHHVGQERGLELKLIGPDPQPLAGSDASAVGDLHQRAGFAQLAEPRIDVDDGAVLGFAGGEARLI